MAGLRTSFAVAELSTPSKPYRSICRMSFAFSDIAVDEQLQTESRKRDELKRSADVKLAHMFVVGRERTFTSSARCTMGNVVFQAYTVERPAGHLYSRVPSWNIRKCAVCVFPCFSSMAMKHLASLSRSISTSGCLEQRVTAA